MVTFMTGRGSRRGTGRQEARCQTGDSFDAIVLIRGIYVDQDRVREGDRKRKNQTRVE